MRRMKSKYVDKRRAGGVWEGSGRKAAKAAKNAVKM